MGDYQQEVGARCRVSPHILPKDRGGGTSTATQIRCCSYEDPPSSSNFSFSSSFCSSSSPSSMVFF